MVKKAVKTGFGLGLLSLAEAKKVAGKVKKELQLNEKESLKLARELMATSETVSKDVLGKAQKHFEGALIKTGLANKEDLATVKKMVKKRMSCQGCAPKKTSPKKPVKKPVKRKK